MMRPVATTIGEVAAAAGVSVATASRVLSGRRRTTEEAARAVREAADRLNYRTNVVARSLRMKSTATVGMVVPRISNPYFPLVVEAVEGQLSAVGLELLLCDARNDPETERSRVEALLERRVDGLLLIPCDSVRSTETVAHAAGLVPVVQVDRFVTGFNGDYVGVDNEAGMRLVLDHLRSQGCRSFALISSRSGSSSAASRLRTYREVVSGTDPDSADRVLLGEYSLEWGREAVGQLRPDRGLPDALVCGADIIALGVIAALSEAGVRVPEEVMVTGFDDIEFASISAPALTTVRQPANAIGSEAVDLLRHRLGGDPDRSQHRIFQPELMQRTSTGSG
jgi:LacI family transcriptional regulator